MNLIINNMNLIGVNGKINSDKDTVGKIILYLTGGLKHTDIDFAEFNSRFPKLPNSYKSTYQIKKYADALKDIICILTGCTGEQLEDIDFDNSNLPKEWNKLVDNYNNPVSNKTREGTLLHPIKLTYRDLLQKLGTDLLRNQLHEDVWVNALFSKYKSKFADKDGFIHTDIGDGHTVHWKDDTLCEPSHFPNWIITDVRFPNEAKAIKDRDGIIIRVNRDKILTFEDRPGYWIKELAYNIQNNIKEHPSETTLDNYPFDYIIDNNGTIDELIEQVKQILIKRKII